MVKRRLPPLNPLRNFEAAARCGSFAKAADELHVTPAAVSRQVLVLEKYFRRPLFSRHANTIELTTEGAALLPSATVAFDMLDEGSRPILRQAGNTVTLCTYQGFLMHWLIPRLGKFRRAHPEIDLNLMSAAKPQEFENARADITIKYGGEPHRDQFSRPILPDIVVPTCAPTLTQGFYPLPPLENLVHHTLLRSRYRRLDWPGWLAAAGASNLEPRQEITFRESGLANQAAAQGLGVAISQRLLIENELANGRLVMPFQTALRRADDIWMTTSADSPANRHARHVCDWIEHEARDTVAGFGLTYEPSSLNEPLPIILPRCVPETPV